MVIDARHFFFFYILSQNIIIWLGMRSWEHMAWEKLLELLSWYGSWGYLRVLVTLDKNKGVLVGLVLIIFIHISILLSHGQT